MFFFFFLSISWSGDRWAEGWTNEEERPSSETTNQGQQLAWNPSILRMWRTTTTATTRTTATPPRSDPATAATACQRNHVHPIRQHSPATEWWTAASWGGRSCQHCRWWRRYSHFNSHNTTLWTISPFRASNFKYWWFWSQMIQRLKWWNQDLGQGLWTLLHQFYDNFIPNKVPALKCTNVEIQTTQWHKMNALLATIWCWRQVYKVEP